MGVIDPLESNYYPDDLVEEFDILYNQENEELGSRKVKFSKTIYIDRRRFCFRKTK